jgi:hypothetical protein
MRSVPEKGSGIPKVPYGSPGRVVLAEEYKAGWVILKKIGFQSIIVL